MPYWLGLDFVIWQEDMTDGFVEWLDGAHATLLDFKLTVQDVGFSRAVLLIEEARALPEGDKRGGMFSWIDGGEL